MKKKFSAQLKQFGKRVWELRNFEMLTQDELANLCDINTRTVQRIENGEFAARIDILFALAKTLNTSAEELLGDIISEKKSK